jgi:hypothetical protein
MQGFGETHDSPPFVTCRIGGQLANNMNQIATTLAYAWDYGAEPFFPELHNTQWNISYNRDRVFFRLNSSSPPRPIQNTYNEYSNGGGWWDCNPISFKPDLYIVGDFFCWNHFHRYRDRLLEVFAPSPDVINYLNRKYEWLLNHPKTISIHVRTYNKEYHDSVMHFLGLEYYQKAMDLFPEDTLFVVFSDRINWCKHHFSSFNKQCYFVEGNDHVEDFFLMSMLKGHVISNSCYSWWAAYLNNQPDKIIIAPRRTGRPLNETINVNIYFPDWILIDPNLNEPYPSDIKDYDDHSTSVDTQ